MSWTIKGEAGKALNATARSFEDLLLEGATVRFASLDADTFVWSSATENIAGGGTIVPEIGQVVELYWNDVRKFRGHVTKTKILTTRVQVTVEGPMWWLKNTPLTSLKRDSTGTESERVSFVFPTQTVAASIKALIERAKALGCPIEMGECSTTYTIPRVTLDDTDCLSALATLMSWVPDAVAWIDYSGPLPKIHIQRRGPATALSISAASSNIEQIDIEPRLDLKVDRVELKYVERDTTTGKPKWAGQSHGTNAAAKRQIVTVSGPEIVDFLPKDDFDSVTLKTRAISINLGNAPDFDSTIKALYDEGKYLRWGTSGTYTIPNAFEVVEGEETDWLRKDHGVLFEDRAISVWINASRAADGNYGDAGTELLQMGRMRLSTLDNGTRIISVLVETTLRALNKAFPTKTTLYRKWDYDFLMPPSGLAENLRNAQNWTPWEGRIVRVFDEVSAASNILGRPLNLTDTVSAAATMKAPLKGLQYEIQRGRVTYELGAPPRNDFGSLVSRIRRAPKDNIEYLK